MTYKRVQPSTKAEADPILAHGTIEQITDALLGVTYSVKDWRWVQPVCLTLLERPDSRVQWIAIQCLGHLATFHKTLDLALVLPALQAHLSDPALTAITMNALEDIAGVQETSYFEHHWTDLPERLQEVLMTSGTFNRFGKRVRQRAFVPGHEHLTGKPSRDRALVARLKQRLPADPEHDWQEYYDEQGNLLRLSLSGFGLHALPEELWDLTSLLDLDLSENQLQHVPQQVGQLLQLESLDLTHNELSAFPEAIIRLTTLQELFLDHNHLSHLSGAIGQLRGLQQLHVGANRLQTLPEELGRLENLLTLSAESNQLNHLPAEIGQLGQLRTLWLQKNQLDQLPAEIGQLRHLQWLDLANNRLQRLPVEFAELSRVSTLRLGNNPFLLVPPSEVVQQGLPAIFTYLNSLHDRGDGR